ncbi:unnamed protein product [Phytophthora fragariaefolia]|uniref:Unnamed protein product n=1 Tax=Phytophthora fragariaefolia TaxID=1490495 RepID=A0A9W6TZY5_9STRA|nr:unnamed protein product [Phytophthora fragariaefolia]
MVKRFLQIKDAAKHVEAVEELVSRSRDCRRLMKLQDDLQALDSICLKLQSNETTLADVRTLFDGVVKRYPGTSNYLTKDATIVHSPTFETAIVKANFIIFVILYTDALHTTVATATLFTTWEDVTKEVRSALESTGFNDVGTGVVSAATESASIAIGIINTNFFSNLKNSYYYYYSSILFLIVHASSLHYGGRCKVNNHRILVNDANRQQMQRAYSKDIRFTSFDLSC